MYTFDFVVGSIIPKSVKCIHSATKNPLRAFSGFDTRCSARVLQGLNNPKPLTLNSQVTSNTMPLSGGVEVLGLGFGLRGRVQGLGFRVQGSGLRI